jgi:linoleoyl-CoA desaturase
MHPSPQPTIRIKYDKESSFYSQLKTRVDQYFAEKRNKRSGNWRLYLKGAFFISSSLAIYIVLLAVPLPPVIGVLLCIMLGIVLAGLGFNIMHDAVHNCYTSKRWINRLLSLTLNALGGNAYIYKRKHIIHHNYPNIDGLDDDIAKSPLMRQCVCQKWVPAHKYQHFYCLPIYCVSGLAWITILDFTKYISGKIYVTPMQKMSTGEHLIFWTGKILYVFFYIALPIYIVGSSQWLVGFLAMNFTMGLILAIVFQLAHVIEKTEFESAGVNMKLKGDDWAVHQLKSTANFATTNKLLNWYVGGLNFQIEHHLFPKISHIHYPAISKIVRRTCREHNLFYNTYPTLYLAIEAHFRLLKTLGRKPD